MTGLLGRWAFAKAFSAGLRAEAVHVRPRRAKRLDERSMIKTWAGG